MQNADELKRTSRVNNKDYYYYSSRPRDAERCQGVQIKESELTKTFSVTPLVLNTKIHRLHNSLSNLQ